MGKLAIIGATGLVGRECLAVLEENDILFNKIKNIRLFASSRSANQTIVFRDQELPVEELDSIDFKDFDIAIFAVGSDLSQKWAPIAAEAGCVAIDNSSAFRYDDRVPLIVPEVNAADFAQHHGIIANPNCSTAQLLVAIAPIHRSVGIERLIVSTYQSASGAGSEGMSVLWEEVKEDVSIEDSEVFYHSAVSAPTPLPKNPHKKRLAFNVIPHIDVFLDNKYTREEMKVVWETRKILHAPDMEISATAVRVPVFRGHSEAVTLDLKEEISEESVRELLKNGEGIQLLDYVETNDYPTPLDAAGNNYTWVGRIRKDVTRPKTIHLWVVSDNLRKGAASNALQIAELVLDKKYQ